MISKNNNSSLPKFRENIILKKNVSNKNNKNKIVKNLKECNFVFFIKRKKLFLVRNINL